MHGQAMGAEQSFSIMAEGFTITLLGFGNGTDIDRL